MLSVDFLRKSLEAWKLNEQQAVVLLGLDEATVACARSILNGQVEPKGRDITDRIACLYHIRKTLDSLLGNEQAENEWLRERHPGLDGARPMDLLLEGSMASLMLVKDHVDMFAGLR